MPRKKKRQRHRGRAFWERTVEEFTESGKSQTAFAQDKDLSLSTLGRWVRLLRPRESETVNCSELIEIVPSTPARPRAPSGTTRLRVGCAAVEFSDLPPVPYMAELLRAVSIC